MDSGSWDNQFSRLGGISLFPTDSDYAILQEKLRPDKNVKKNLMVPIWEHHPARE